MIAVQEKPTSTDRISDGYEQFATTIIERFNETQRTFGKHLFTTDADGLFDAFLAGLPEDARQHYTCNCCRQFIHRYGGLVAITDKGTTRLAMWDTKDTPEFFQPAVMAMNQIILNANVTGVFLSNQRTWGTPVTGEWHHMHVAPSTSIVFSDRLKTASQVMAERVQDYEILSRSLTEYTLATVEQAIVLLQTESLYRSEKCLGVAEWFRNLLQSLASTKNTKAKQNLVWLTVASAPVGFTHIRSSMIGTLLDDIQAGMEFGAVARRFAEKMSPANYQRAQVAPTVGGVQQAEKIVKQLGLENSLQRRYMAIDEVPEFIWRWRDVPTKATTNGVFAGVETKQKAKPQSAAMELPTKTMTWVKFRETVLPTATKLEIKAENADRFAALVTAAHPDSENIFQWNNRASWYYHSGVDAEIRRRVESAGGRYEDNEIRCSLLWNTYSDLDIHVIAPNDGHIYFGNKQGRYGYLDVDMNVSPTTLEPVENIRWKQALDGNYQFYVRNYNDRNCGHNPYKVELEVAGKIHTFEGVLSSTGNQAEIAHFVYQRGVTPTIRGSASVVNGMAWNVAMNEYHTVTGIVKSPNLWGDSPVTHAGDHTFFLIDGCKDTQEGKGRGFFNEMLKPELREIRKTLEAFTANTPIASVDSPACGLGYSKSAEWNATIRVTSALGVATYKIDRWD